MIAIGFTPATGIMGRAIKWQTRSPWSHALLVYGKEGYCEQWNVIEAYQGKGVLHRPFVPVGEDRDTVLFRVRHPFAQSSERRILDFAERQIGKPYDWTMVARFVSRRQESRETSGKWFCSELAYAAFWYSGIELLRDTKPWEVSPGLLARSPLLESI